MKLKKNAEIASLLRNKNSTNLNIFFQINQTNVNKQKLSLTTNTSNNKAEVNGGSKTPRNTLSTSSSEHSITPLKSPSLLENQQNMDLIRESTKAKLIFMHQKLTTQKILNKSDKSLKPISKNITDTTSSPKGKINLSLIIVHKKMRIY